MKSLREPYDSLIESLKRPTHDGTFDWPSPDPLHMSAVKAIEELIAGLSSQIGISTTLRSALATAEATAAERGERIAKLEEEIDHWIRKDSIAARAILEFLDGLAVALNLEGPRGSAELIVTIQAQTERVKVLESALAALLQWQTSELQGSRWRCRLCAQSAYSSDLIRHYDTCPVAIARAALATTAAPREGKSQEEAEHDRKSHVETLLRETDIPAICMAGTHGTDPVVARCGWKGTVPDLRTSPCPKCGTVGKLAPLVPVRAGGEAK